VNITVDVKDSSLAITSMKDGNVIDTYNGLIVAGTATSGDVVTATVLWPDTEHDDRIIAQCEAFTDTTGRWSCNMPWNRQSDATGLLIDGVYEMQASTTHQGNETAVTLTFTVENKAPAEEIAHSAKGGSCSMALYPPASAPWWLAVAAFFGIILIPLRRREK
jgi:hypothetical protein